jgi:GWxTD domain-containing protein
VVRIDYRMGRTELLFQRGPAGYGAAYQLRVIFFSGKGNRQVTGDAFSRQLRVASYAETRVRGQDIVDQVTFQVPPGRYRIQVYLTDLIAERTSGTAFDFEVPKQTEEQVWLSDLSLGIAGDGEAVPEGTPDDVAPNPSRRYAENVGRIVALGEIVDRRTAPADSAFRLHWTVADDFGSRLAERDTTLRRSGSRTAYRLKPGLPALVAGSYRIIVELRLPAAPGAKKRQDTILRQSKGFEVEVSRLTAGAETRGSLEVLRYVATDQEVNEMSRLASEKERAEYWDLFWKRRDPTPDTSRNEEQEEFYKRVRYADQHFGTAGPGWKTDMGRTYIRYGPPDEVDRRPFNFDRPSEEIWYYYRDKWTFVFVDREGFGRYELVQTTAPQ